MMTLYDYPDCPFSQKVRVVLAAKDLEFERRTVDLSKNEQRSAEFLKLNPFGKVPVLVDEDVVVYDSTIINEYLEDEYPDPRLMPEDSAGKAQVRMLEDLADNLFVPRVDIVMREFNKPEETREPETVLRFEGEILQLLRRLEVRLAGREFLVGEFSLADAAFAPRLLVLQGLNLAKLEEDLASSMPNVSAWVARLRALPAVASLGL